MTESQLIVLATPVFFALIGIELVVGIARKGNADELRHHGAQLVVNDLGELVN